MINKLIEIFSSATTIELISIIILFIFFVLMAIAFIRYYFMPCSWDV